MAYDPYADIGPDDGLGNGDPSDYIAPDVVPYPFSIDGTTEYTPLAPGTVFSDGPTPAQLYPGMPSFAGYLDLKTGLVTEQYTGTVRSWFLWQRYQENFLKIRLLHLCDKRDLENDLINLPGTKPWFHDDWYKFVRDQRPPRPEINF